MNDAVWQSGTSVILCNVKGMKHIKLVLVLLLISSCVRQVDLVVGDRQVVVDCVLSEDEQQILYLSLTNGKTGINPEALQDALATLTDLTESKPAGTFVLSPDGIWTLDYTALPEHSYRLEVEVPGYGTVRAEDTMPPAVDVSYARSHFDRLNVKDTAYFYHYYDIKFHLSGMVDHYEIRNVFYQSESIPEHLLIQGFVYDELTGRHQLSDMMCTDCPGVSNINLNGDIYVSDVRVWETSTPDGWVYGRKLKLNAKLDGVSCHSRFLRIEKEAALRQDYFTVSGDFPLRRGFGLFRDDFSHYDNVRYIPQEKTHDYLLFTALSPDYARFIDETSLLVRRNESNLLSDLYIREDLFSNIEGGVGIFGATTKQALPLDQVYTVWEEYKLQTH